MLLTGGLNGECHNISWAVRDGLAAQNHPEGEHSSQLVIIVVMLLNLN
jgi:hypothetical protein